MWPLAGFWGQIVRKNKPREATEGVLRAQVELGYPEISSESFPPSCNRQNRQPPASDDGDDVLGSAVEATNNPLASFWFGWRSERDTAVFAGGIVGVFPDRNEL